MMETAMVIDDFPLTSVEQIPSVLTSLSPVFSVSQLTFGAVIAEIASSSLLT